MCCGNVVQRLIVCCSVLQCVAVCCSVLQCVAVCCSVLQSVAVRCTVSKDGGSTIHPKSAFVCTFQNDARRLIVRCGVLQCAVVCCSVLQCVAVCCSVLWNVAVCCSVLQYVKDSDSAIHPKSALVCFFLVKIMPDA